MLSTTCETTKFCGYDRALFSMAHGTNVEAARDDVLLQAIFSDHARAAVSTRWLSEWLCWSRDEPRSGTLAARLQAFFSGDSSKFRGLWCSFGGFFHEFFQVVFAPLIFERSGARTVDCGRRLSRAHLHAIAAAALLASADARGKYCRARHGALRALRRARAWGFFPVLRARVWALYGPDVSGVCRGSHAERVPDSNIFT